MGKNAFRFIMKILYLFASIIVVAITITNSSNFSIINHDLIIQNISASQAEKLAYYFIGENYPEPYELIFFNLELLIISLLGIFLFCAIAIILKYVATPITITKALIGGGRYFFNTIIKFFSFAIIFWLTFRILPYNDIVNAEVNTAPAIFMIIVIFNFSLSLFLYIMAKKIIELKRKV